MSFLRGSLDMSEIFKKPTSARIISLDGHWEIFIFTDSSIQ
jgi:hypothetical protein